VGNPLKNLNSYVIKGEGRNLLIDTGFNQAECLDDLTRGIRELTLDMEKTDIFLTHFHADHTGLVSYIASPKSRIYMGALDIDLFKAQNEGTKTYWDTVKEIFIKAGFPEGEYQKAIKVNPVKNLGTPKKFECIPLEDNDIITLGSLQLRCIHTPGHTPGHLCLYHEKDQVMFLGDHVLFDITPNITMRISPANPVREYMKSLIKIKSFAVKLALPAHRENTGTLSGRVEELLAHHKQRLEELCTIVAANPGISGYTAASKMKWSIRAKNWADFPAGQKWFAVAEAAAHLEYLIDDGSLLCETTTGVYRYYKPSV
jgi:glyoxylase-like metal-dependent hydrolase (beta-lactamase superfamily II)